MVARNTDVGFMFGDGGSGLGVPPFDLRSTDGQPAIFTSLALRDTYYSTTAPADIASGSDLANRRTAVGIGANDGNPVGVTAAFVRNEANDGWIPIPVFIQGNQGQQGATGPTGPTGPAGADGIRRSFPSEAARDAFYATQPNRDDLSADDVISVNMGSNLVEFQRWVGASQPTSYDANNFITTSISTANASISFGQELRIFDFGEFTGYINEVNNTRSLSIAQPYTDAGGSQNARQLSFPGEATLFTTTGTTNSANQQVHEYSFNTTGVITNTAILLQGTITFVVAPQFYILEVWIGTDDTGTRVFRQRFEPGGTAGLYNARPEAPQRFEPNTTYFIRLTGDAPFQYVVGDNPGDVAPIGTGTGFEVTYNDLATQQYVMDTLAGFDNAVAITGNVTITPANVATYDRKLIYTTTAVTNNLTITLSAGLSLSGFAVFPFGSGTLTIAATNPATIQGVASYPLSQFEGVRVWSEPGDNDNYGVIYSNDRISTEEVQDIVGGMVSDNTENNITVTYDDATGKLNFDVTAATALTVQDEGVALTAAANTLNFTGAGVTASGTGATKTITIPGSTTSTILTNAFSYSATGTQNVGVDLVGGVHILASTVTGFDFLVGTTLTDDGVFAIVNQNTSVVEFDVSATAFTFAGDGSGNAYNLPGSSTTLFWVTGANIYPIANTGAGGVTGTAPLIVARDTPSQAVLAQLAAASTGGNSALWVVANDQIQATEDTVPSAVQIRALGSGLLTADNSEISTTAVNKSTVRLQRGTQVRVFSDTDLRVISTPTIREQARRYPDISTTLIAGQVLNLVGNQVLYNIYRNRTAVIDINTAGFVEVQLPSLQNAVDLAYLNRADVFCFRHAGTNGEVRVRTFQVGTVFSDSTQQITLDPGEIVCVSPAPSGAVWTIVEFGQFATISLDPLVMSDWYRDGTDATAADNFLRLHHRRDIVDGDIRGHIQTVSAINNPITIRFQSRNIQDDLAWYHFWSVYVAGVPAVGVQNVEVIELELATALTYIETNINNGQDFQFDDPILGASTIEAITHVSGDTVRVELFNALPAHIVVNDIIIINNSTVGANNGTWAIETIAGDRLDFTISIPGASATNNTGAAGFIDREIYADAVLVSHGLRQVNFNIYSNSGRTNLITSFPAGWFSTDTGSATTMLAIGYNNDIETRGSQIAIQDDTENFFLVKGGPRRTVASFDNAGAEYQVTRTLPISFEDIEIRTDGVADFLLPEYPADFDEGEVRRYTIHAHPLNGDDDTRLYVGDTVADSISSDEGLTYVDVINGSFITIELYRTMLRSGWRIISPMNRSISSGIVFSTAQDAATAPINPLPVNVINTSTAQSEDQNRRFFGLTGGGGVVTLNATADYDFRLSLEILYTGPAQTGVLFVPLRLITRVNNVDQEYLSSNNQTLLLARYTAANNSTVLSAVTLDVDITDYQGTAADTVEWRLEFGALPPGITTSNFSVKDFVYTLTAKLRLD